MTHQPRAILIKCRPDTDYYVGWSTVVEAPAFCGTAADARAHGYTQERIDRADENGSSSIPGFYTWDAPTLIAEQRGVLPRRFLRAYVLLYSAGEMQAAFDLVEPFEHETEVRRA